MNEVNNQATEVNQNVDPQAAPKVMQQHEINALVSGVKNKAHEKGHNEGYQKAYAEIAQQGANSAPAGNVQQPSQSGSLSEEKTRQIAAEEFQKQLVQAQAKLDQQRQVQEGNRILGELHSKVAPAKSKFEDFNNTVDPDFKNFEKTPEVLHLANMVDNSGEVLYDLAKNPTKSANIALLFRMGMQDQAFSEMKKLSDSIKQNEMAVNQPKPKAPLAQVTPSTVGVGKTDEDSYASQYKGKY